MKRGNFFGSQGISHRHVACHTVWHISGNLLGRALLLCGGALELYAQTRSISLDDHAIEAPKTVRVQHDRFADGRECGTFEARAFGGKVEDIATVFDGAFRQENLALELNLGTLLNPLFTPGANAANFHQAKFRHAVLFPGRAFWPVYS